MSSQLMNQRELFEWLHSLDLSHYFEPFLQNGYENLRICAEMGESDLEITGVRDIHEKIELLQAIRHLRVSHFGRDIFNTTSSSRTKPVPPNYLDVEYQTHFQNGESDDDLKYCLQKRYLSPSRSTSSGKVKVDESPSCCNSDYQDIDDCDCGPGSFYSERFHKVAHLNLTPRKLQQQRHPGQLFPNDVHGVRRKYPEQQNGSTKDLTRIQLRDDHPIRRPDPLRTFGPGAPPLCTGLTQESSHLYGSPYRPTRKVESDLDSSSGIEPDLVSSRRGYDYNLRNSNNTNTTGSSSTTPDEPYRDQLWTEGHRGSWYQPPLPNFGSLVNKSSRNGSNQWQLKTGSTKRSGSTSSPKSSTLSRRQRDRDSSSVVPTVSGLVSGIDAKRCYYQESHDLEQTMATNLNCREFDYEPCCEGNNTYEEITNSRSLPRSNYRTPTHSQSNHQYIEHVIVSASHPPPPMGYGNDACISNICTTKSPTKPRQIYTPGIYSPSSCLMDRDDIYDYAPPLQRNRHSSPAKCSPFRSKGKGKPKAQRTEESHRGGGRPMTPLCRSTSILTSHSTPTYANVGKGTSNGTSGGNGPKVLSFPSSPSSQNSHGCRTLANLSKLSRRLGLGRLFRSLRIQVHGMDGNSSKNMVMTKPRVSTGTMNQQTGRGDDQRSYQISSVSNFQDYTVMPPLSSLPSNERIIETINRLKYEELQKRKERIAQEHQMEQTDGPRVKLSPSSLPKDSPEPNGGPSPTTPSRFSNPMKGGRKNNKSQGDGHALEEDSIEALVEDFGPHSSSSTTALPGNGGNSPSKSLLSKVKELGARNHKKLRRFSFSSKSSQSEQFGESGNRRGSDFVTTSPTKRSTPAIQIVGNSKMDLRNSSEEELSLSSLPSVHHRSLSICDIEEYDGPYVGTAEALVDYVSSPYDLHALSYKKGDILKIIEKKPTGSWKGKLNNKVGYFKFINVQVLPDRDVSEENGENEYGTPVPNPMSSLDSTSFLYSSTNGNGTRRRMKATSPLTPCDPATRQEVANVINGIWKENAALLLQLNSRRDEAGSPGDDEQTISETYQPHSRACQSHSGGYQKTTKSHSSGRRRSSNSLKKRPRSVGDLLERIKLEEHIPLFILHGFESLDLFKGLEEEDLDRLNILQMADRVKIMTAVELLRDYDAMEEIPPIIIPTYSSALLNSTSTGDKEDDEEDPLNQILEPPPNFTRGVTAVRDSGVFLKCDDKEEEDPEVEEIILSPSNLPISSLNPSDSQFLMTNVRKQGKCNPVQKQQGTETSDKESNMAQFTSLEEHYGEVRQRFLQAKSLFESSGNGNGGSSTSGAGKPISSEQYNNQFLYCEKSSDSGISLGANSPPPN